MNYSSQIEQAKHILQSGGVVAFPTETVYGLGANVFDINAIHTIFTIKNRPADNPLIVHIASLEMLGSLVTHISKDNQLLIDAFWPGPLSIVFPKSDLIPDIVTAGLNTVVIRFPRHPMAQDLIQACGFPIAAPSVNPSGKPSSTHHQHVRDYFGEKVFVIEGNASSIGIESTVITTLDTPRILRKGAISQSDIEKVLSIDLNTPIESYSPLVESPGMKYPHYAPNASLYLIQPQEDIITILQQYQSEGYKLGALVSSEVHSVLPSDIIGFDLGSRDDYSSISANLYHGLHFFDSTSVNLIIAERFENKGLGIAIMDRLIRAASKK